MNKKLNCLIIGNIRQDGFLLRRSLGIHQWAGPNRSFDASSSVPLPDGTVCREMTSMPYDRWTSACSSPRLQQKSILNRFCKKLNLKENVCNFEEKMSSQGGFGHRSQ